MAKTVKGRGLLNSPIVFLGEAPATEELKKGYPFAGKSGKELEHYCLPLANITRDQIRFENVFEWMIPLQARMKKQYLSQHFDKQVGDTLHRLNKCVEMKVVVALGTTALKCLGIDKTMETAHGIPHRLERDHILNQDRNYDVIVMPCYHPASGLRQPDNIKHIRYDFQQLNELLWGDAVVYPVTHTEPLYLKYDPKLYEMVASTINIAAIDSEWTVDNKTWCFTISTSIGLSFLVWPKDMHDWKNIIEDSLVIYHNAVADKPRLEACGIYPTREIDTMVMAYHLELAQSLKVLSYRLLGIEQRKYRDVVRNVEVVMAQEYLEMIASIEWEDPEPFLAWNSEPKKERVYTYHMTECTKRKKGAYEKDGEWYYDKKAFDEFKIVPGTENGHEYMKQPQNIGKMAQGALNRESDPVAILAKWKADERLDQCKDAIGEWTGADLSMIPLEEALPYACADADCTLQITGKLYQLYKKSGIPMPEYINQLEGIS